MILEFAVDPQIFGTLNEFRLWSDRFGVNRARLIARYPQKWEKYALRSIRESGVKRTSLVEKIRRLDEKGKILDLGRHPFDGTIPWFENAIAQDRLLPFHRIIASENGKGSPRVLIADDVEEETDGWYVETGNLVPRTADKIAEAIRPILRAASRLVLVDPYFHPSETKFNAPLRSILAEAVQGNPLKQLELHLAGNVKNSPPTADFQRACTASLPGIIPPGLTMTLYRWREAFRGDSLHPRYVLTDVCGVRIDHGLDEETEYQSTDIDLLPERTYRMRCGQYCSAGTAFDLIDTTVISCV